MKRNYFGTIAWLAMIALAISAALAIGRCAATVGMPQDARQDALNELAVQQCLALGLPAEQQP